MPLLIALLAAGSVTLSAWVFLQPRENLIRRRLRGEASVLASQDRRVEGSFGSRVLAPVAQEIGGSIVRVLPHNLVRSLDHMLIVSNSSTTTPQFLALWAGSAALGAILFSWVLRGSPPSTPTQYALLAILIAGPFALGPYVVLRRKMRNRQRAIIRALPDALDLLVTAVSAGLGVDAAFALVAEKVSGPLAEIFALYLRLVGLGRPRREAFAEVAERSGVLDLIRVSAAVAQAEQMGGTLADVLTVQAEDLRVLRLQRAREAAQRAPVLMTIPMTLCFLPATSAVVVVPSILNLMEYLGRMRAH